MVSISTENKESIKYFFKNIDNLGKEVAIYAKDKKNDKYLYGKLLLTDKQEKGEDYLVTVGFGDFYASTMLSKIRKIKI